MRVFYGVIQLLVMDLFFLSPFLVVWSRILERKRAYNDFIQPSHGLKFMWFDMHRLMHSKLFRTPFFYQLSICSRYKELLNFTYNPQNRIQIIRPINIANPIGPTEKNSILKPFLHDNICRSLHQKLDILLIGYESFFSP